MINSALNGAKSNRGAQFLILKIVIGYCSIFSVKRGGQLVWIDCELSENRGCGSCFGYGISKNRGCGSNAVVLKWITAVAVVGYYIKL